MSREQGPRVRGCERPRVQPSLRLAARCMACRYKEEAV